jgi:hypothetical protein
MYKNRDEEDVGLLENNEEEAGDKQVTSIAVLNIENQEENNSHSPQPITIKRDGARRYCRKCKIEKFDRTHHCSQCKR